jgi:ribosomal protein S18 acetylase RimI-like enzyme
MSSADLTQKELLAQGWQRCFIADEPRLSEAVQTYEELGFEVILLAVEEKDGECTECMKQMPDRFKVIYTRKKSQEEKHGQRRSIKEKTMAAQKVTVRQMRQQDVPTLVEIDSIASGTPRAQYLQSKAHQALDSKHGMVISLVAENDEGAVVGFLMGQVYLGEFGTPESVATVDTVGIHPDLQCQGVARMLMEEFLSHTRNAGVERIRTMVDWSQWDLLGFFHALGFAPGRSIVLEREV